VPIQFLQEKAMKPSTQPGKIKRAICAASVGAALLASGSAHAALVGYQSQSAFNTAIAGWTTTSTNFEAETVGTTYAAGAGPAASGFTLGLTGGSAGSNLPAVNNTFWTTSGTHYLGLDNPDTALQAGDSLTFSFTAPVHGFGLFVIGSADLWPGDMRLTAGAFDVTNSGTPDFTSGAGDYAYFLGLVSDNAGLFSSVTLDYALLGVGDLLPVAIDDVVLAVNDGGTGHTVPEPGTLGLMLAGLLALGARSGRSRT
jgi:hypothetical protein